MRTAQRVIFLLALSSAAMHGQTRLGTAADEAAILKNRDAQNAAFNTHDAVAYAALAALDADRIILEVDNEVTRPARTTRNHASFVYVKRNNTWEMVAQRVIPKQ